MLLNSMSVDLLTCVASSLAAPDLARASMTCTQLRAAVEQALRHRRAQPEVSEGRQPELPDGFTSWIQKLLFDERRASLASVPKLSINHSHGAVVFAGRLHVWGTEYVSPCGREMPGLLGHGIRKAERHVFDNNIRFPTPVVGVEDAVSVSCGREHTLALTSAGEVFAFGNGEWGQCGAGPGRPRHDFFAPNTKTARLRNQPVLCRPSQKIC